MLKSRIFNKELFILWVLGGIFAVDILLLWFLLYSVRIILFFYYCLYIIQLFWPTLAGLNIIFIAFALFGKGKLQTARTWGEDVLRSFKFFAVSLIASVAIVGVCAGLGMLLGISMERVSSWNLLQDMREWVQSQVYD